MEKKPKPRYFFKTQNFKTFSNIMNLGAAQIVKPEQVFQRQPESDSLVLLLLKRVENILQRLKILKVQKRKPKERMDTNVI